MLKESGIGSGWDDEMREIIAGFAILCFFLALIGILISFGYQLGVSDAINKSNAEKTALEIKILQHELAAYEAMEKELKE